MRFEVEVDGASIRLEIDPPGSAAGVRVAVDGRPVQVDAVWVSARELSLLVDGKSFDLEVLPDGHGRVAVNGAGRTTPVWLAGAGGRAGAVLRHGAGAGRVTSPMPGKVVAVLVAEGQPVAEGKGVVVVEAMKMENELPAPVAGTVVRVHVQPGQVVEAGTVLVEIEAAPAVAPEPES